MKFIGFSKGSWPARLALLTLVGLLIASLGILNWPAKGRAWAHDDHDQDDDDTKLVWSVKFVCHLNLLGETIDVGEVLFTGNTVINIHNPTEKDVELNKKVVYAIRESARSGLGELEGRNIGLKHGEVLIPNDAFFVDCAEIATVLFSLELLKDIFGEGFFLDIFFPFPLIEVYVELKEILDPIYFDGFLVIEAKGTKHHPPLVVNAHHWLIGLIAGTSRQIVQVEPVEVKDKFELCEEEEPGPGCFEPPNG